MNCSQYICLFPFFHSANLLHHSSLFFRPFQFARNRPKRRLSARLPFTSSWDFCLWPHSTNTVIHSFTFKFFKSSSHLLHFSRFIRSSPFYFIVSVDAHFFGFDFSKTTKTLPSHSFIHSLANRNLHGTRQNGNNNNDDAHSLLYSLECSLRQKCIILPCILTFFTLTKSLNSSVPKFTYFTKKLKEIWAKK